MQCKTKQTKKDHRHRARERERDDNDDGTKKKNFFQNIQTLSR